MSRSNAVAPDVLAVDLGGTNMRAAIVAADGRIVAERRAPTPHGVVTIDPFVDLVRSVASGHDVAHAVFALPGRVDHEAGVLEHAPNIPPGWREQLRADILSAAIGLPVTLGNDADVAAVGEAYFGAGRDWADVVYVTISTGFGAGVVVRGRVYTPRRSAGEVGHTVIDRVAAARGEPCTVENLGSGAALGRLGAAAGIPGGGAEVMARARAGDPVAVAVWEEVVHVAGLAIANVAHLFAPGVIVVGGGMGRNGEFVLAPLRAALERFGPDGPACPAVLPAALGDDSGLVGAAAWSRARDGAATAPPAGG